MREMRKRNKLRKIARFVAVMLTCLIVGILSGMVAQKAFRFFIPLGVGCIILCLVSIGFFTFVIVDNIVFAIKMKKRRAEKIKFAVLINNSVRRNEN